MRRMLSDKLTKSIKEVVNAYNEGEFSAVAANPATTTETLTAIEIDGTGYAVGGGTEYTAGTGIDITSDVISVDTDTVVTTNTDQTIDCNKTIVRRYTPESSAQYKYNFASPNSSTASGVWEFTVPNRLYNSNNSYYAAANSEGIVDIKDLVPTVAEPDNKTIVVNGDGNLETAVGGWKEVVPVSTETVTGFIYSGADFDITDSTQVNELYNKIKNLNTLTMTFTCSDGTNTYTPEVTFSNVSIQYGKWNYNNERASTTGFSIEFYVDTMEGNEKIHIYFSSSPVTITEVSSVSIEIPEHLNYHTINSNYIPDITNKIALGSGIGINNESQLYINQYTIDPITIISYSDGIGAALSYDSENFYIKNNSLATTIDGGYVSKIKIDKTQITAIGDNYTTTQTDLQEFVKNVILSETKEFYKIYNPNSGRYTYSMPQDDYCLKSDGSTSNPNSFLVIDVDSTDSNICTVTLNGDITYQFGYITYTCNLNTDTITPDTTTYPFVIGSDAYNFINANVDTYFYCKTSMYGNTPKTIDAKFVPYDNSTIILDGNDKLSVASPVATNRPFYNGVVNNGGSMLFSKDGTNYSSIAVLSSSDFFRVNLAAIDGLSSAAIPSTAGTYALKCTVDAQGNKTFSWVLEQ